MWKISLYQQTNGYVPVAAFIDEMDDSKLQAKVLRDIELLEQFGNHLREPHTEHLEDKRGILIELRTKQSSNIVRIYFFFEEENNIILLTGIMKKKNKAPKKEIELAFKYKKDYIMRRKKHEE